MCHVVLHTVRTLKLLMIKLFLHVCACLCIHMCVCVHVHLYESVALWSPVQSTK